MELSLAQWVLIAFAVLFVLMVLAHFFLPFSFLPKEDPLDQRIARDLPEVSGPSGEHIIVSAGPVPKPLPRSNDEICIVGLSTRKIANECGHDGPQWYQLNMFGLVSDKIDDGKHCPDCLINQLRQHVIRCSLCGLPIFPGNGVALYHESSEGLKHKDVSVRVGESYIGCLRWDCCPSGGFFAGHWSEDGFKPAFQGPDDTVIAEVMRTGQPVIRNI